MDELDWDNIVLLQQILATDTASLSAVELAAFRDEDVEDVDERLERMANEDNPLVTTLDIDHPVGVGVPSRFYAVTQHGIDLLKQARMYEQIGILYDSYRAANDPTTEEGWAPMAAIREVRPSANRIVE